MDLSRIISELVPFGFFATVVLVTYYVLRYKFMLNKELLEKGVSVDFFKKKTKNMAFEKAIITFGLILLGIGFGILFATMSNQIFSFNHNVSGLVMGASVLIFGGLSLILAFVMSMKIDKKYNQQDKPAVD